MPYELELPEGLLGIGQTIVLPIPEDIATLKLPDPTLIDMYRERSCRQIFIEGEITEDLVAYNRQIMEYNREDRENNIPVEERQPIYVYIYSNGGDLTASYSLIATIEASVTPVVTINMGMAYSGGCLILLAGHRRYCLRRSEALIHQGYTGLKGSISEAEEGMKAVQRSIAQMKSYVLEKTNIDEKLFNKNKSKDWWISDEQQVELGLVDAIVRSVDEIM